MYCSHENKENELNEKVCPNIWPVVYLPLLLKTMPNDIHFETWPPPKKKQNVCEQEETERL